MIAQVISHAAYSWTLATVSTATSSMWWLWLLPQTADAVVLVNLDRNEVISRQGRDQREGLLSSSQAPLLFTMSSHIFKAWLVVSVCCLLDADTTSHTPVFTSTNSPLVSLACCLNPIGVKQGDRACPPVPDNGFSVKGIPSGTFILPE